MTEESTIQCESCGTIYNDWEEVCPYCAYPNPLFATETLPPFSADYDQDQPEELFYPADESDPDFAPGDYADSPAPLPADEPWLEDENSDIEAISPYEDSYDDSAEYYDEADSDIFDEYDDLEAEEEVDFDDEPPPRSIKKRYLLGCLGLFLCVGLFYGGIGLLGAYHGLQERSQSRHTEAEAHYQRGEQHLANNSLDLAIAEFELALSLNPNLIEARQALNEAQSLAQAMPTPTSETRAAAAAVILETAEAHIEQQNWTEALDTLANVRDLDNTYQADYVSDLIFTTNAQLAQQNLTAANLPQAVPYLEAALSERPDDPEISNELERALSYLQAKQAELADDKETAIDIYKELYQQNPDYLDVKQRLLQTYQAWGDELLNQQEWCRAESLYVEAAFITPTDDLQEKVNLSAQRCQGKTDEPVAQTTKPAATPIGPAPAAQSATPTASPTPAQNSGDIYFSAFNPNESRWEIMAVPAAGGTPSVIVTEGTMPALSPNGRWLVYRSEQNESEGLHIFDLTSGQDQRLTIFRQDILPRWGGNNQDFLFVAQEPATGLWKIQQGFADGKGDPVILRDGRTPDLSPNNNLIAYQGTDPAGNNPGIYLAPMGGGEATRLTNHQSDRSPDFSPAGNQLAYMSTRGGNWDIYVVDVAGSAPRRITDNSSSDGLPAWSPDGNSLAYISDAGGRWGLYTISAAGGEPVRLADWDGLNRPDWLTAQIWWGP